MTEINENVLIIQPVWLDEILNQVSDHSSLPSHINFSLLRCYTNKKRIVSN
jgi:hypothetical protein